MKKSLILCLLLILTVLFISAQSKQSNKIKLDMSKVVYVASGGNVFHLYNCEKLGRARVGMTVRDALSKGYTPCPYCIPIKKEQPIKVKTSKSEKTEEQIEASISQSGFRKANWGMTMAGVKELEENEFIENGKSNLGFDTLIYKGNVGEFGCIMAYYFTEDILVEGRYIFVEKHTNKNLYINDFREVKSILLEKYGIPTTNNIIWNNDLYKDDSSEWGIAVSVGHLAFESIWQLPKTKITLQLQGDNYEINHALDYKSELDAHKKLVENLKKKSKNDIW